MRVRQLLGHFWTLLAAPERSVALRNKLQNAGVVLQSKSQTPDDQVDTFRGINGCVEKWRSAALVLAVTCKGMIDVANIKQLLTCYIHT